MAAWGIGPFENDDAADWVNEWEDAEDLSPARDALTDAILADDYLEAREGSLAIAAAQVVAVLVHRARPETLPDEIRAWVDAHPAAVNEADVQAATLALDRVLAQNSELFDLWQEAGDDSWVEEVRRLRSSMAHTEP